MTDGDCVRCISHPPLLLFLFLFALDLNGNWHWVGHMLRIWTRTKRLVKKSETTMWSLNTFGFLVQVCCRFVWQTKSAFPELIFSPCPTSREVSFVCSPCLLTLWQPESSWIVREEWLFVSTACCRCGFDCLSRQHGLKHDYSHTDTHSHPCGWTFLLAGLPDGTAGSVRAATIRRSDWLCFSKAEQHHTGVWRL